MEGDNLQAYFKRVQPHLVRIMKKIEKPYTDKESLIVVFRRTDPATGMTEFSRQYFKTDPIKVDQTTDYKELARRKVQELLEKIETHREKAKASNFVFDSVEYLDVNAIPYDPLNAGTTAEEVEVQRTTSGSSYIRLPAHIEVKKCVINPQNFTDERCFEYGVIALAVRPEKPHRVSVLRKHSHLFSWNGLEFPVKVRASKKNVYLLLISDGKTQHYTCISNIHGLLNEQNSRHVGKLFFCDHCCVAAYRTENGLKSHQELCYTADGVREELYVNKDTGDPIPIGFKNHNHSMRVPAF